MDTQPKPTNSSKPPKPRRGGAQRQSGQQGQGQARQSRGGQNAQNSQRGQNAGGKGQGGGNRSGRAGTGRSRGEAIRAQKRSIEAANKIVSLFQTAEEKQGGQGQNGGNYGNNGNNGGNGQSGQSQGQGQSGQRKANFIDDSPRLKIIGLGGMDHGGSKNMMLLEYMNDALIIDCGNDLGVDLPGINYGIVDTAYLDQIKFKIRGYVITHGHLDHIGGMPHILPKYPAPVYGSRFSIGRIEEIFQNFGLPYPEGFELKTVIMNEDNHERLKVGEFMVELVRVTHSIPGSTIVVVDTPVGRVINTGDFRLDPNPLDHERTDTERLKQLGDEGVHVLLSESTTTERPGRTPSESTIEPSYIDIMDKAPGRIFMAVFSTNVNRVQMVVNAAVHHGRKIALDGRSMMSTLEMAVRNGFVKIPKGTFVPIANINSYKDNEVVIVCTGSQGEENSALQRMAIGDHKHVKLKAQDTVILSSTPIPETGNDAAIGRMVDDLMRKGVHVFSHMNHEIDGVGPLHVSGHASIDEYREMIQMTRPKYFMPIYGAYRSKQRHIEIAVEEGIPRANTINAENGDVIAFTKDSMEHAGSVPHGTLLVDQSGALVSNVVVKDRIILAEEGLVAIVLTIDRKSGQLLTSPDIISRGFIYMRDSEELMNLFRAELRRAVAQRFKRVDLDRFKQELKEHVTHFLYEHTQRAPIVIPVVNLIGKQPGNGAPEGNGKAEQKQPDAAELQQKFARMRAQLLNQDARTD